MRGSISLGRILGFPVDVHVTLLILLGLIGLFGGGVAGVLLTVLVFVSVLAHELGHSLVARGLGVPIDGITLYPFGGMARMTRPPRTPRDEILIAGAGPLVSLALAGALGFAWTLGGSGLLGQLALINGVLGVFNLIPALPMDGGRIFRAALASSLGFLRATRIATAVARVSALGLGLAGLVWNPMLLVVAFMVWWMSGVELRAAEVRAVRQRRMDPDLERLIRQIYGTAWRAERRGEPGARAADVVVEVLPTPAAK